MNTDNLLLIGIVLLLVGCLMPDDKPQGFDAWLAEHEKTCQQCREEEAICVPAFKKMQAMLREGTY